MSQVTIHKKHDPVHSSHFFATHQNHTGGKLYDFDGCWQTPSLVGWLEVDELEEQGNRQIFVMLNA